MRRVAKSPVSRSRTPALACSIVALLASMIWSASAPPHLPGGTEPSAGIGKGIIDGGLEASAPPEKRAALIQEVRNDLGARWVRVIANWSRIEPMRGAYSEGELSRLDGAIHDLHKAGMRVVLTTCYAPRWASDKRYWSNPPPPLSPGYQPFYAIQSDALADYGSLGRMLSRRYGRFINGIECWNEPNLGGYIYPQRTADDPYFAARLYLRMLKALHAGVRRGDATVRVIAGATAPVGLNDRSRTSPQRFARFLARHRATAYFDVYSHHPYTPGGTINAAPGDMPNDSSTTVVLGNLPTLLRLFPRKPFYLTEYGYNTRYTLDFGLTVTPVQQARYVHKAYAYVKRFPQVKTLMWYLVQDRPPPSGVGSERGLYTGLRETNGTRKLSWFTFAGGNRLTITAPVRVKRGQPARVGGTLRNRSIGAVSKARLLLQSRALTSGRWTTLSQRATNRSGRYVFWPKPRKARAYRVVWRGVKTSPTVVVRVR